MKMTYHNGRFFFIVVILLFNKLGFTQLNGFDLTPPCSTIKSNFYSSDSNSRLDTCQHQKYALIIKIAPFDILLGDYITNSYSFGLSVEKPIFKSYSIGFGAKYIFTDKNDIFNKAPVIVSVNKINGFSIDSELRRYFSKNRERLEGFYGSPSAKILFTQAQFDNYYVNRYSLGLYYTIGFQDIVKTQITYDFGIGLGLRYVSSTNSSDVEGFYSNSYHFTDGGKKPYHEGSSIFPAFTLNLKVGLDFSNAKNENK